MICEQNKWLHFKKDIRFFVCLFLWGYNWHITLYYSLRLNVHIGKLGLIIVTTSENCCEDSLTYITGLAQRLTQSMSSINNGQYHYFLKVHIFKILLRETGSRKIVGLRNTEQVDLNQRKDYLGENTLRIIFVVFFGWIHLSSFPITFSYYWIQVFLISTLLYQHPLLLHPKVEAWKDTDSWHSGRFLCFNGRSRHVPAAPTGPQDVTSPQTTCSAQMNNFCSY